MQKQSSIDKRKTEIQERKKEATSRETLRDLEKEAKPSTESQTRRVPSPDGALDEHDEVDDAGPM